MHLLQMDLDFYKVKSTHKKAKSNFSGIHFGDTPESHLQGLVRLFPIFVHTGFIYLPTAYVSCVRYSRIVNLKKTVYNII